MSEGFAEFSASLYVQYVRQDQKKFLDFWNDQRDRIIQSGPQTKDIKPYTIGPVTQGYRLSSGKTRAAYQYLVYPKGAYILHMIRMMFNNGRDHDKFFQEMMKDFIQAHYNQDVSTEDFKRSVEKHMSSEMDLDGNQRLDWFFNEYVYGTSLPTYKLESSFDKNSDGDLVFSMKLAQSGVDERFRMLVPIYLELADGHVTSIGRVALVGNTSQEAKISLKGLKDTPHRAMLNYYDDVLASPN